MNWNTWNSYRIQQGLKIFILLRYLSEIYKAYQHCLKPVEQEGIGDDRYDKETNLYYYRARYLDPIMGRFLQTDPMGYRDSMNLYQAFNQNPVNYLDPFGETTININIERFKMTRNSTIGKYKVELTGLEALLNTPMSPELFWEGYKLLQRSKQIDYYSLERRWARNKRKISCIPIGTHKTRITPSPTFQQNLPELDDVPGNRGYKKNGDPEPIRIHRGNSFDNVQGCILFGTTYDPLNNEDWIGNSNTRVRELVNLIEDVRTFDTELGEQSEVLTNISIDKMEMFKQFYSSLPQGENHDAAITHFARKLWDMDKNNASLLRQLENGANFLLSSFLNLENNQKIIFRTEDNAEIERRNN